MNILGSALVYAGRAVALAVPGFGGEAAEVDWQPQEPALAPPTPAITATAPGPAAPDMPATMAEAATRPARQPNPPAPPSSTPSSSNSA